MTVRLEAGASESRVLAHEILHLYGTIHVLDDLESLIRRQRKKGEKDND